MNLQKERYTTIQAIPESVTVLDLTGNHIESMSQSKLHKALYALPEAIHTLILRDDKINELSKAQQENLLFSLPWTIKTLIINHRVYDMDQYRSKHLISKVAEYCECPEKYLWFKYDHIKLGYTPDGQMRDEFINYIQHHHPQADAYFLCGLLLEGRYKIRETEAYELDHKQASIDFYLKAKTEAPELDIVIDGILAEMYQRTTYDAIQQRLQAYKNYKFPSDECKNEPEDTNRNPESEDTTKKSHRFFCCITIQNRSASFRHHDGRTVKQNVIQGREQTFKV